MNSDQAGHGWTRRILEELGLVSVYNSSGDFKLLCLQRFVRFIAYGASTLILVLYLEALAITKTRIGLFMTLTMVGDVVISFFLTLFADAIGRKAVLGLGAALMVASGVVFALSGNYWVLLAAAIFGVISPRYAVSRKPYRRVQGLIRVAQWKRNRTLQSYRGEYRRAIDGSRNQERHLRVV